VWVRGRVESVKIVKHGRLGRITGVCISISSIIIEGLGVLRAPVDEGGVDQRQSLRLVPFFTPRLIVDVILSV
jgi:hypothetical protein